MSCIGTYAYLVLLAFLSYLRLSVYMAVVSIAIVISFHLKSQPTKLELRMARPLGIIFWFLSLSCLALGFGNYIKTVQKYSRRVAIVQTGWKTQTVSGFFGVQVSWRVVPGSLRIFTMLRCDIDADRNRFLL